MFSEMMVKDFFSPPVVFFVILLCASFLTTLFGAVYLQNKVGEVPEVKFLRKYFVVIAACALVLFLLNLLYFTPQRTEERILESSYSYSIKSRRGTYYTQEYSADGGRISFTDSDGQKIDLFGDVEITRLKGAN